MATSNALICISILIFATKQCTAIKKPHIIFILADDMGWNDVGFHGMTDIPTPNIDALAANSVILNNYYTAPICSPSRAALMSGMYPSRTGMHHKVIGPASPYGFPLHIPTMANHLNKLGYTSKIVGKWHLGQHKTEFTPLQRGFKSHFGFWPGVADYNTHAVNFLYPRKAMTNVPENVRDEKILFTGQVLRDELKPVRYENQYLTDILTEKSVDVIRAHNNSTPLFLYLAHHAPHRSNLLETVQPPKKYTEGFQHIKDEERLKFAGHLTALDLSVGKVMKALAVSNMLENSIVIFSTDNGASAEAWANGGSNWPLRGEKSTGFEGGVRGVGMIWSQKLSLQKRGVWNGLMHITDWLPTLYSSAGGNTDDLGSIDGLDVWDAINQNDTSPRKEMLLQLDPVWDLKSIRVDDYKLVSGFSSWASLVDWDSDKGYNEPIEDKIHSKRIQESDTFQALANALGKNKLRNLMQPIRVNCGPTSEFPEHKCQPKDEPCLFNVADDPCEYRNIAKENPQVVESLLFKLKLYEESSVSPLDNNVFDYLANPALHDGYYVPWLDDATTRDHLKNNALHVKYTNFLWFILIIWAIVN